MAKKSIEERVSRIEKIFWVVFVVAAIFGVGGTWGAKILKNSKTKLDLLSIEIANIEKKQIANIQEKVNNMIKVVEEQERKSIEAVKEQESHSQNKFNKIIDNTTNTIKDSILYKLNQELSDLRVSFDDIKTQVCNNPKSGSKNNCRCAEGKVLLGVLHKDVKADDNDTEQVVGIECGTPIIH